MSQNSDSSLLSEKLCLLLKTGSRDKKIINRYFRKSYIIYLSFIWLFIVTFWARLFSYYIFLVVYITLFCLLLLQTIWLQRNLYLLLYISNWDRLSKCHVWCESNDGVIVGADEGRCWRGEYWGMAGTMAGGLGWGTEVVPETASFNKYLQ